MSDYFDPAPVIALQGDADDADFAHRLGVSRKTVIQWRRGRQKLYRPTAEKVALKLDRHPLELWPDLVDLCIPWREQARCRNTNGRYHLADMPEPRKADKSSMSPQEWAALRQRRADVMLLKRKARDMCDVCPVRLQCLDWVLRNIPDSTDVGIWAGTSRNQRVRMRKALQREAVA